MGLANCRPSVMMLDMPFLNDALDFEGRRKYVSGLKRMYVGIFKQEIKAWKNTADRLSRTFNF